MQFSTSVWMHQETKAHANSTVSVIFIAICTLDLKPRGAYVIELCPNSCIMHRKQSFLDTKVWLVQNMLNTVSCTVVSMKHVQSGCSCAIVSSFIHHISLAERKPQHPKYHVFIAILAPVWGTRPTKKGRFHDTPVQLVRNVRRFASCVMLHSSELCTYRTIAKNMVKITVSLLFASLCRKTWKQDWLFRGPSFSEVTHYAQIMKFPWPTSRMCTAVHRTL